LCVAHTAPTFAGEVVGKLWTADNKPGAVADFLMV